MSSTNGHKKTAVLYCRVSTDEQVRSGFSLAQQLEALREYANCEGYEILEEVPDPGQSGASLERPGMDRVRDLVAAGGISVVLAQDRDRFAREPAYHYLLKKEFEEYGTKMRALNDRGDESPEGELTDGILNQLAKFERAKTTERTRRGRLRKAREGKVIAGRAADYGFDYNEKRDGYVVNEERMAIVRRIFRMVGVEGISINGVRSALEAEGVPPPLGPRWQRQFVRGCVLDDVYKPHTFEEIRRLVSPEVAERLDPNEHYGVWWYNRRSAKRTRVSEGAGPDRHYRERTRYSEKPREEWIAVPVPDAGIPGEVVEKARAAIENNERCSGAGRRFWELSGGIFRCSVCGYALVATTTRKGPKRKLYYYYHCPTRRRVGGHACSFTKTLNAPKAEATVWGAIRAILSDPERLRQDLEAMIEEERQSKGVTPEREAEAWVAKLAEVERKRVGYLDLAADGVMTKEELKERLTILEETRKTVERELRLLDNRRERLQALERDKDLILESCTALASEALDNLDPEERRVVYKMLGLTVEALPDGALKVSGAFGEETGVWEEKETSTR